MDTSAEMYILTGHKPVQIEGVENLILLAVQTSQRTFGAWASANMEPFGRLRGIVVCNFFHPFELFHHARLTDSDARLTQTSMKNRHQCQSKNAIERVHTEHLVRPVARGGEADEIGVFHISECSLDVMLAPIAKYDFFVGKVLAIRKQNPFAENTPLQFIIGSSIRSVHDSKPPVFTSDLRPKEIRDILAGNDLIQIFLKTLLRIGFSFPAGFMTSGNTFPEIAKRLQLFSEMLPDAAHLSLQKSPTSGDYDRAFVII